MTEVPDDGAKRHAFKAPLHQNELKNLSYKSSLMKQIRKLSGQQGCIMNGELLDMIMALSSLSVIWMMSIPSHMKVSFLL